MNLLHIDSSILGPNSISRVLSSAVVAQLQTTTSGLKVIYRDLAAEPLPHLSGAYLAAAQAVNGPHETALQHDLALSSQVLEEFLAADIVVIGVAFYNFTISTQLKAWIDRILIAGKTFRYTEKGPEGLAGAKRVLLAVSRGGFYGPGTPTETAEHGVSYLKTALGFIGIYQPIVVAADGLAIGPEQREASVSSALQQIAALPSLSQGIQTAAA